MPRMPPVTTTQVFGDIATATRIESIENARLIELDAHDRRPERRQAEHRPCRWRRSSVDAVLAMPKKCE